MYSLCYKLFYSLNRINKKRKENGKNYSSFVTFLVGYLEWFYNIPVRKWYENHPSKKNMLNKKHRDQKIIVSFTSYPKRIKDVWLVVETLLRQSLKPDMIILWVAKSQFNSLDELPARLVALQKCGLTIRFCDDLRSHKKYFYVMQEYPNDLIVLVDDDTFYSKDLLKELIKYHKKYPKDIISMTSALITDVRDLPSQWRSPRCDERLIHSYYAQPYSGQGTLYPPHCLDERIAFDKDKIMHLCPYADDLWLKLMSMRNGTTVSVIYKFRCIPVTIYGTTESSLYYINAEQGKNDEQWKNLLNYYGEDIKND